MTTDLKNPVFTLEQIPSISQEQLIDRESHQSQLTIALLPCCDLFEDFFDTIGMSLETFCTELTGGWMFNYIDALKSVGVRTVLFFISNRVSETTRFTHIPTGSTVCVLPASKFYRKYRNLRSQIGHFGKNLKRKPSDVQITQSHSIQNVNTRSNSPLTVLKDGIASLGSYISTPLGTLIKELRHEGCNAIVCQDYEYARFDVCVALGKLLHLPVFATFQGGDRLPSLLEYPFRWIGLRASSGLIIASEVERERVKAFYKVPTSKISRIFNPMDVTAWGAIHRAEARLALGIPDRTRIVVYHGRIQIWQKGLDILLEAWEQICRDRPSEELCLLLVGTGSDAAQLHQRIDNMQLKNVMWVDEYVRDRNAIQQYLSAADVYTLPSRKEGFPVAPIEAMACGLPVVASDTSGISDIFEGGEASGGLVVPRENAESLALALERLLDDEALRQELGKRAQRRARECFSLEAIGLQLRQFLLSDI